LGYERCILAHISKAESARRLQIGRTLDSPNPRPSLFPREIARSPLFPHPLNPRQNDFVSDELLDQGSPGGPAYGYRQASQMEEAYHQSEMKLLQGNLVETVILLAHEFKNFSTYHCWPLDSGQR
jgi:hypothetical protein